MIIIGIIVVLIYVGCPLHGKIVLLGLNTFLPDPIPFVDEIIMWVGLAMHIEQVMEFIELVQSIHEYIDKNTKKSIIFCVAVVGIISLILFALLDKDIAVSIVILISTIILLQFTPFRESILIQAFVFAAGLLGVFFTIF